MCPTAALTTTRYLLPKGKGEGGSGVHPYLCSKPTTSGVHSPPLVYTSTSGAYPHLWSTPLPKSMLGYIPLFGKHYLPLQSVIKYKTFNFDIRIKGWMGEMGYVQADIVATVKDEESFISRRPLCMSTGETTFLYRGSSPRFHPARNRGRRNMCEKKTHR